MAVVAVSTDVAFDQPAEKILGVHRLRFGFIDLRQPFLNPIKYLLPAELSIGDSIIKADPASGSISFSKAVSGKNSNE